MSDDPRFKKLDELMNRGGGDGQPPRSGPMQVRWRGRGLSRNVEDRRGENREEEGASFSNAKVGVPPSRINSAGRNDRAQHFQGGDPDPRFARLDSIMGAKDPDPPRRSLLQRGLRWLRGERGEDLPEMTSEQALAASAQFHDRAEAMQDAAGLPAPRLGSVPYPQAPRVTDASVRQNTGRSRDLLTGQRPRPEARDAARVRTREHPEVRPDERSEFQRRQDEARAARVEALRGEEPEATGDFDTDVYQVASPRDVGRAARRRAGYFVTGAAQMGTLGYRDEILGALAPGVTEEDLEEAFALRRDAASGADVAAEVLGSIAGASIPIAGQNALLARSATLAPQGSRARAVLQSFGRNGARTRVGDVARGVAEGVPYDLAYGYEEGEDRVGNMVIGALAGGAAGGLLRPGAGRRRVEDEPLGFVRPSSRRVRRGDGLTEYGVSRIGSASMGDDAAERGFLSESTPGAQETVPRWLQDVERAAENSQPERVRAAAIRYKGQVYEGASHAHAVDAAVERGAITEAQAERWGNGGNLRGMEWGFVTNGGRYVDDNEANALAGARESYAIARQNEDFGSGEHFHEEQLKRAGAENGWPAAQGGRVLAVLPPDQRAAVQAEMQQAIRDGSYNDRLSNEWSQLFAQHGGFRRLEQMSTGRRDNPPTPVVRAEGSPGAPAFVRPQPGGRPAALPQDEAPLIDAARTDAERVRGMPAAEREAVMADIRASMEDGTYNEKLNNNPVWRQLLMGDNNARKSRINDTGSTGVDVLNIITRTGAGALVGGAVGAQDGDPVAGALAGVAVANAPGLLRAGRRMGRAGAVGDISTLTTRNGVPRFYSRLERAVQNGQNTATGEQWLGYLNGAQSGIAKGEREWAGIDQWLRDQGSRKVSKQEVLEHLASNRIRIGEVVYSGRQAKHEYWTVPGDDPGTYRELLLVDDSSGSSVNTGNFHSKNWHDVPNVLVHARLGDRTLSNGERVLFIHEIQSEWHQQGRQHGYLSVGREPPSERSVPDAAFKNTDEWLGLALKRIIDEAVDDGYDRVAWATGRQTSKANTVVNEAGNAQFYDRIIPQWVAKYGKKTGIAVEPVRLPGANQRAALEYDGPPLTDDALQRAVWQAEDRYGPQSQQARMVRFNASELQSLKGEWASPEGRAAAMMSNPEDLRDLMVESLGGTVRNTGYDEPNLSFRVNPALKETISRHGQALYTFPGPLLDSGIEGDIARAGAGAVAGGVLDTENPTRGAAMGAAIGAGARVAAARLRGMGQIGAVGDLTQLRTPTGAPRFYSRLEQAVRTGQNAAPASQWLRYLDGHPGGIAKGEREWTGVDEWLKAQGSRKVTREEVMEYLNQNRVQVGEVSLGGPNSKAAVWNRRNQLYAESNELAHRLHAKYGDGWRVRLDGIAPEDSAELARLNREIDEVRRRLDEKDYNEGAEYDSFKVPGGEPGTYREVLLTLPQKSSPDAGPKGWGDTAGGTYDPVNFRGPHWDESNVLAHIRMDDRTLPSGERVLFVHEIQSDWHQQGRKHGYSQNPSNNDTDSLYRVLAADFGGTSKAPVPDAPFKNTDEWLGLAMKRVIDEAVVNGYDRVGWSTGDQIWSAVAREDPTKLPGLQNWYDRMVPQWVRKYGNKVGVEVEPVYIPQVGEVFDGAARYAGPDLMDDVLDEARRLNEQSEARATRVMVRNEISRLRTNQGTPAQRAHRLTATLAELEEEGDTELRDALLRVLGGRLERVSTEVTGGTNLSFRVTPALRETVGTRGQALYTFPGPLLDALKTQSGQAAAGAGLGLALEPEHPLYGALAGAAAALGIRKGFLLTSGRKWRKAIRQGKVAAHAEQFTDEQLGALAKRYERLVPEVARALRQVVAERTARRALSPEAVADRELEQLATEGPLVPVRKRVGRTLLAPEQAAIVEAYRAADIHLRRRMLDELEAAADEATPAVERSYSRLMAGLEIDGWDPVPQYTRAGIDVRSWPNLHKFGQDATGRQILERQVRRVVEEAPEGRESLEYLRQLATSVGADPVRVMRETKRGSKYRAAVIASMQQAGENVEAIKALSLRLAQIGDDTVQERQMRDWLTSQIDTLEQRNLTLMSAYMESRTNAGRDLNLHRMVAARSMDPVMWRARAQKILRDRGLLFDERVHGKRIDEIIASCH